MGVRLSENEKLIYCMVLFPIFWPFIPVVLICMGIDKLQDMYLEWKYRKRD